MRKKGVPPKNFNTKWSPKLAYAVGLLATDGSLSKDGRHIDFSSTDKDLVVTFCECLALNIKIGIKTKSNKSHKIGYRAQFGSVTLYKWLESIGFTPNKSKTLGTLKIPRKYFFEFFRGCFDGDGCIYAYWDPRWRSSYMFYLTIASASPSFLEWLQQCIKEEIGIEGKITKARNTWHLRFAKNGTRKICKKMYKNPDAPLLKRKFTKVQKIFSIDNVHNCAGGEIW